MTQRHCWPTLFAKVQGSTVYDVSVQFHQCTGLLCNCTGMERNKLIGTSWFYCKIDVKPSYIISLRGSTKNRFLEDVIEPTIKPRVSPLSVSKGTGVSGAAGPHTLLTASLVGVTSKWGAASLALTIISLATLPCWCWWRPWTNTAIWIQLDEFSALRVRLRASPRAEHKRVGNFNSRVVTSTLKRRRLQRGKNDKIIETDVAVGL